MVEVILCKKKNHETSSVDLWGGGGGGGGGFKGEAYNIITVYYNNSFTVALLYVYKQQKKC